MANEAQIINGSFKGIPIAIDSGAIEGGIKAAVHTFPNRDTQNVEALGKRPRRYSLDIIVSAKPNTSYVDYRNSLLAALESGEPGPLIHPLYGRIENVVAVNYSLNERFSSFGDTTINATFEITENIGIPQNSGNVITQIAVANVTVVNAVVADISKNYSLTQSFAGNFAAAVDKVNSIIDQALASTAFIGESAATLNNVAAEIGELSANVNSLVTDPIALADSISNLFESVNGLYASAEATFETMAGFFGFGEDDVDPEQTTAGRAERKQNREILNAAVAALAIGDAYVAASRFTFETVRDIDEVAALLDTQYDLVLNNGGSQETKDAVTDIRIKVLEAFATARITAGKIISVYTLPTTARLLGFSYYGNDNNFNVLISLNNLSDISFIEGDVEVITE